MQHVFSPMFEEREMAKPSTVFLESETDSAEIKVLQRAIRNFRRRIATMRALINNRVTRLKALFESATPIERADLQSLMRRKGLGAQTEKDKRFWAKVLSPRSKKGKRGRPKKV